MSYQDFLESKTVAAPVSGFDIDLSELNPVLKEHQKISVQWACKGGRRALFESFGLGKSSCQLEYCRMVLKHEDGTEPGVRHQALIVCPLGVKQEFTNDAENLLGWDRIPEYVRDMAEIRATDNPILLTNYERVRDGDIDPTYFTACCLDEASVLRSFGSKTYQTFLDKFKGVRYKLVATATPDPNKYKELIHYAGFLEVMDSGQALTRFFQRDSTKANNLTIYPHKEEEFWLWVSTWAFFLSTPSDLGLDAEGYELPPLDIRYHKLPGAKSVVQKDGQIAMFNDVAEGLSAAAREKRESLDARVACMMEIVKSDPEAHFILWHDLEDERRAIGHAMRQYAGPGEYAEIYGTQEIEVKEKEVLDFAYGRTKYLATKKEISGQGCNFQRFCHRAIFVGVDYKFNDFIQAIHRIYRFMQTEPVIIDIIYTENEDSILKELMAKWDRHNEQTEKMREIITQYGIYTEMLVKRMQRSIGVERVEVKGKYFTAVNNDCVDETKRMETDSVGLIHTSIPFSNHYEYTPSYNDFGHNEDNERFFEQMDYLTPELLRILKPGRICAVHVKDRILYGNATGDGMPTVDPFSDMTVLHYMKHGFRYMGRIIVLTDVVRENNQTYRLGWSEVCKDGSKMGVGCPEYILLFRKLPTDTSKAYADEPVVKSKEDYTRAQWQLDAHAFWRSSGDRLITKEELMETETGKLQKLYTQYSRDTVYSYEDHVALAKKLDEEDRLPATFMVCAPGSWSDMVWDDIVRMRTLNGEQKRKNVQMHVCLAAGSLILTRDGYKPIEEVEPGDMVLTHMGRWKPVIAKARTGIKGTVQTRAKGVPNLITTPDHKLWTRRSFWKQKKEGMRRAVPEWVEAKDTVGHYVNLKLPPIEESPLNEKEWWLVGRYLADGHKGTRGDWFISVGADKCEEFERMALGFYGSHAERDARQYRLLGGTMSDELKSMLDKCGRGAMNKQVPIEGICLNPTLAEALLSGYLSGDGNVTGNCTSASSVSRALLLGMAMVAQRARGVIASVYAGRGERTSTIEGREVHCNPEWVMSWRVSGHHCESEILEDGAWKKVKESIATGEREVWSIQVEDDASYTAEGCVVKNCPLQLDIVERIINRYSNEGDVVYDPFGGLMTVPMTAVKMGRYGIGCELNNGYFRDGVGYLKLAEEERDEPEKQISMGIPTLADLTEDDDAEH